MCEVDQRLGIAETHGNLLVKAKLKCCNLWRQKGLIYAVYL